MRSIQYLLLITFIFLFINCKKKDEVSRNSECSFTISEITVPNTSGKAEVTVKWAFSEWEISTSKIGFLSGFTYLSGGSLNHSNNTRITFTYTDNETIEVRTQDIILTNKTTGEKSKVTIKQDIQPPIEVSINPDMIYQNVTGFGGMNNVWAAGTLSLAEVEKMYSQEGLGYNMMRIMIWPNKNDWGRDVATTLKAQSLGARILASPWTPPADMKSTKSNLHGYLLPEKYEGYVNHLNDFIAYMKSQGVNIEAVSIQNEPDWSPEYDGCEWTPEQILDFIKHYGANINAKVLAAEAVNFKKMYTDPVLNDATAVNNLDIVGGHLYGGGLQDYPLARAKGKEIWMTEHLLNEVNDGMGWDQAMVLAKELNDCMKANFNAYFWWYLKRSYSMLGDGEKGTAMGETLKRGYVLSHYAKYATGRKRIQVGSINNNNQVEITAYNGNTDLTFVMLNQGSKPVQLKINLPVAVKSGEAVVTTEMQNMAKQSVIIGENKQSVTVSLPVKSVVSVKLIK